MNKDVGSNSELKNNHRKVIAELIEQFDSGKLSTRSIQHFLTKITRATDQTLIQLWSNSQLPPEAALVAVGGYGRGELFPYSDVDVLLLLPDGTDLQSNDAMRTAVETFIARSWDLGLHIGSSVRTIKECLKESAKDITVQTAQLESRWLTGDQTLYKQFFESFRAQMDIRAFVQDKLSEMRRRHQKYEGTPYALEPNCKESPGGLRDLHVILWVTKAAQLGNNWSELEKNGLITELEKRQVRHNEAWLKLVRARLHLLTHRHEDRLIFDVQEKIASSLGYKASTERRASEVLMRHYYRTAKAITQINQILILSIVERLLCEHKQPPRNIDPYFLDRMGTLDIARDDLYQKDPHQILRTFLVYTQEAGLKTLSARTFRALYNARNLMDASFRKDPLNAQTFMAILKAPQAVTRAFRLMSQTSVLESYLWAFRRTVGQMQHDLFHVYTVDQHILMVLRNMRRFFIPEFAHEYPLCSEIAAEFDKPWLLYLAALFHDIAKGRGGDHSSLGALEVKRFAKNHGINKEDTQFIEFLVTEHLTMSHIAQKEDTGNAEVINNFVKKMGDERHLNALYLLTVADIRGTSPKVWNTWKARLLEYLYNITLHVMGGHVPEPGALVATRQRKALEILQSQNFPSKKEQPLWAKLELNYFMRHEASDIAWHTQMLWDKFASPEPVVRVRMNETGEGFQVLVYTPDRPDLFAHICGYFSATDLSIVDARIHTTHPVKGAAGWALDTFQLLPSPMLDEQIDPKRLENSIAHNLHQILLSGGPLPQLHSSYRISRRAKYFPLPPIVELHPDETQQRWLLNITAGDRVGLLYTIARVLAKDHIDVELAKISTLGDRIEDTFLISSPLLASPAYQEALERTLCEAIQAETSFR